MNVVIYNRAETIFLHASHEFPSASNTLHRVASRSDPQVEIVIGCG